MVKKNFFLNRFLARSTDDQDYHEIMTPQIQVSIEDNEDIHDPFTITNIATGEVSNLMNDVSFTIVEGESLTLLLSLKFEMPEGIKNRSFPVLLTIKQSNHGIKNFSA